MGSSGTCRGCGADLSRCDCEETASFREEIASLRAEVARLAKERDEAREEKLQLAQDCIGATRRATAAEDRERGLRAVEEVVLEWFHDLSPEDREEHCTSFEKDIFAALADRGGESRDAMLKDADETIAEHFGEPAREEPSSGAVESARQEEPAAGEEPCACGHVLHNVIEGCATEDCPCQLSRPTP